MKTRHGFVSNSSSSSFVVIDSLAGHVDGKKFLTEENLWVTPGTGEYEFGWQNEAYHDVHSRVNFALLQADSIDNQEWRDMIQKVIVEHTGAYAVINNITSGFDEKDKVWGYIDHQSAACEGENTEMFKSEQALKDFLFGHGSYIQCGNDNGAY